MGTFKAYKVGGTYDFNQAVADAIGDITPSNDSVKKTFTAGEIINGGKAVRIGSDGKIYIFDINNPTFYGSYVGIAETAAVTNDLCVVVISGLGTFSGSSFVAGTPYYIAATGLLTSTPPSIGLVKKVAVGVDSDTVLISETVEFETI